MKDGINLKKQGAVGRMIHHPVAAMVGSLSTAVLFGVLGTAHGNTVVVVVVAALGAAVGAPLGAFMAASNHQEL